MTPQDKQMILNFILGGGAIGAAAGAGSSLINYLQSLKEKADKSDLGEAADNDTLYVDLPSKKEAFDLTSLTAPGVGAAGSVLSAGGAYLLMRKLYQNIKRKQLLEDLEKAQHAFVGSAQEEAAAGKQANTDGGVSGRPLSTLETLGAAPVALLILATLASGGLTYKALDKAFPSVKQPFNPAPKRVVVRRRQLPAGVEDSVDDSTSASPLAKEAAYEDGMEFLTSLVLANKQATESDARDIVHAVASGRHDEIVDNLMQYGLDTTMATIKGAYEKELSHAEKHMAISLCVKSAALGPVFNMLVAAEYNGMAPNFTKLASSHDEDTIDTLVNIGAVFGSSLRKNIFSKDASYVNSIKEAQDILDTPDGNSKPISLPDILKIINSRHPNDGLLQKAEGMADLDGSTKGDEDMESAEDIVSEDSISSDEEKQVNDMHPTKTVKNAPHIIDELGDDDDAIDAALSKPIVPALAVAAENA